MRLSPSSLNHLKKSVRQPNYDRTQLQTGIVHLGLGAFHRAHQAAYTDAVLNLQLPGWQAWGISGVSLRSAGVREQMNPQHGLYTVVERSAEGEVCQVLGAIKQVLVGAEDREAILSLMAAKATKIITITVTEKGYCHDPGSGELNVEHPQIAADLQNPAAPQSCVGFIVAALQRRMQQGLKSFTVLSCDNLPSSGQLMRNIVMQYAERVDPQLAQWIATHTAFPDAMIDRIVPATTEDDKTALYEKLNLRDEAMVVTESFNQWVIQDTFSDGRPPWEKAGVLMVDDVAPYKALKLRLLNGSHSLIAYTGFLAGYETVSEAMSDQNIKRLVRLFMDRDAGETVIAPEGFKLAQYKQELIDRFCNPGLKHRTAQIAMDGSQKIPQRITPPLREQLSEAGNKNVEVLCLTLAAWIRFCAGVDEQGARYTLNDPMEEKLQQLCQLDADSSKVVASVFALPEIFGNQREYLSPVVDKVAYWLDSFKSKGMLAALNENRPYI